MRSPLLEVLDDFYTRKKSLVAFNIQTIEQLYYLAEVAEEGKVPVIVQFSSKYISYFEEMFGLKHLLEKFKGNYVYFHLDHCVDPQIIELCISCGFDSVMYDGSSECLKTNIENSNRFFQLASQKNCLLEVELGAIQGVEDGHGTECGELFSFQELEVFARESSFHLLALAIGNAHGVYTSTSVIKVELLEAAKKLIGETKFVLHGGTGMDDEQVIEAIQAGVVKINISTALKIESYKILSEHIEQQITFDQLKIHRSFYQLKPFYQSFISKFTL